MQNLSYEEAEWARLQQMYGALQHVQVQASPRNSDPSPFANAVSTLPLALHPPMPIREPSIFTTPSHRAPRNQSEDLSNNDGQALDSMPGSSQGIVAAPAPATPTHTGPVTQMQGQKRRQHKRTPDEKLEAIFKCIQSMRWSIGDFLYYAFRTRDEDGRRVHRSISHGSIVANFLAGHNTHPAIKIIDFWLQDTVSRATRTDPDFPHMFSPSKPYHEISHARVAITAMCVQLSAKQMRLEQKRAVRGTSGLHGSAPGKHGCKVLSWEDIGSHTIGVVQNILQKYQPVTLHLLKQLASPTSYRNEHGVVVVRKTRPPDIVASEVLSMLNFSHTKWARLLPAARSVLFFACGVPRAVFDYASRIGLAQSWHATFNLLRRLAEKDTAYVKECGHSLVRWLILRFDNVQQYLKQRDRRLGRENTMKVGMAAYVAEAFDFELEAADLEDYLRRVRESKRDELMVAELMKLVDWDHAEIVAALHWLQALVNHVPALAHYKPAVAKLWSTDAAKLRVPARKTKIFPLGTVAKNEAVTSELREGIIDFLAQIGQQKDDYIPRIIPIGGDGLSFEKLVQMKNYLQFEDDRFQRFEIIWPFLEIWHTTWTFLSTIFETHFDNSTSRDPSTLSHSSTQIDQKAPPNLKKVDYYPGLYTSMVVLDARVLDCWRIELECDDLATHFMVLAVDKKLPTLDELRILASKLHRRYSTTSGWEAAMGGGDTAKAAGFVEGSRPWCGVEEEDQPKSSRGQTGAELEIEDPREDPRERSAQQDISQCSGAAVAHTPGSTVAPVYGPNIAEGEPTARKDGSAEELGSEQGTSGSDTDSDADSDKDEPAPFIGDQTLMQTISFMSDALLLQELSQAVSEGDIGRVWNAMKILIFRFAGSSHSKYTIYLLEMTCILELESSPVLRDTFLKNWLVNPSGEPGRHSEGDLVEEHLNLVLEEALSRKGAEWDSPLLREVHAPNAARFLDLKNEWGAGVGLAKRRGKHPEPHSRPEIRTLLRTYKDTQLHTFCAGRSYGSPPGKNLMHEGLTNLLAAKMDTFRQETTRARLRAMAHKRHELFEELVAKTMAEADADSDCGVAAGSDSESGVEVDMEEGRETIGPRQTNYDIRWEDGEMILDERGSWDYDILLDEYNDAYDSSEEHVEDDEVRTDQEDD